MIKKEGKILIEDNEQIKLIQQSQLNYELKMKKERNEKLNENENEEKNNEDKNEKEKTKLKRIKPGKK